MKIAVLIARVVLGLLFLVFGLNGLLHFIPGSDAVPPGLAGQFAGAMAQSHYFHAVAVVEIVAALLLLPLAAHYDHLRNAWNREQPLPNSPVGQRPQLHRRGGAVLAVHAENHDLSHDRRNRRELRAYSLRKSFRHHR